MRIIKSKCRKCQKYHKLSLFWKDKSRGSGVCSICKNCYRKSDYGDKKRKYLREYMCAYNKSKKNQQKLLTRSLTKKAIKKGLIKVENCKECGAKAEAHHPDYTNHLKVIWLCDLHHRNIHITTNNP